MLRDLTSHQARIERMYWLRRRSGERLLKPVHRASDMPCTHRDQLIALRE